MKTVVVNRCLFVVVLFFTHPVWAAVQPVPPVLAEPFSAQSLTKVLLALVFILALIFLAAWVMKRVNPMHRLAHPDMEVLATLPLAFGTKEKLTVVRIGTTYLLLGVAPGRVDRIHEFDECPITESANKAQLSPFLELLKKQIKHEK